MNIALFNHYPAPISFEQNSLLPALRKCCHHLTSTEFLLPQEVLSALTQIEFNLVDDETISNVHDQFMNDPTTTDVITFQHGEVFICYDMAKRESTGRKITLEEELLRYHIHGMLHLAGYDDQNEADFNKMFTFQEELVKRYK